MKIAVDASCLVINPFSGLSEMARSLLSSLHNVSCDTDIMMYLNYLPKSKYKNKIQIQGIEQKIIKLPRRFVDFWWKQTWIPIDLYLRDIDIFHSLYIQVPPTKKIKTVLTVHDCRFLAFPELYTKKEVKKWQKQMEISLNRVDMVVTDSEFTRNELLTYFRFPEDRCKTIYCGFSPYFMHSNNNVAIDENFKKVRKLPNNYIIYTGVLDPRKNLARLIEAIAICKQADPDFPDIAVTGISNENWLKSKQAKLAYNLGILKNIHIAGTVEKNVLIELIRNAFVLCYPSIYEGFGYPPLEAMSLGVPVIAGKGSSISEVAGAAACLVDPFSVKDIAHGLIKVVYDNSYRDLLINKGYKRITMFSCRKAADKYTTLYYEVNKL